MGCGYERNQHNQSARSGLGSLSTTQTIGHVHDELEPIDMESLYCVFFKKMPVFPLRRLGRLIMVQPALS